MPTPATIENVAKTIWPLIQTKIKGIGTKSLTNHLGKDGTDIVARHFPKGWLTNLKVGCVPKVPLAKMDNVWKNMGYPNLKDFEAACKTVDSNLFDALQAFSDGNPMHSQFLGITYNKVIFLKMGCHETLDNIVHELVHTLQWANYTPGEEFLRKYIKGFVGAGLNYFKNPAEKPAKSCEDTFRNAIGAEFSNVKKTLPKMYQLSLKKMVTQWGKASPALIPTLKGLKSIGIDKTKATKFMAML